MSIIFQGFYWNAPVFEEKIGEWWNYLQTALVELERLGVAYLWLPPLSKSSDGQNPDAMGYDAYDYYDLGNFEQKGSVKTLFGNIEELGELIEKAHDRDIKIIVELCFSHCRGGEKEVNPYTGGFTNTKFNVKSGRFIRNYEDFYPCRYDKRENNSPWKHLGAYDYCTTSPHLYEEFLKYAAWLKEEICVDGFRYDNVKAYSSFIPLAIQRYLGMLSIGEYWDERNKIGRWLEETEYGLMAFDFPLRGQLKEICHNSGYDFRNFWGKGLVFEHPHHAVTFVENHDTEREAPIKSNKLLAYAMILTMEGFPVIFWKDYFVERLGMRGTYHGIERLIFVHHHFAGGRSVLMAADEHLLIFGRDGDTEKLGLVTVINTDPENWRGRYVQTRWKDRTLSPIAWYGNDIARPIEKHSYNDGGVELYAPPLGYAIYTVDERD